MRLVTGIEPVGTVWINGIRMTVIPLVVSLLVGGAASASESGMVGPLGGRALLLFLALLAASALSAVAVVPPLFERMPVSGAATEALRATTADAAAVVREGSRRLPTVGQWVAELAPANPLRAAADGALLPLVVFAIAFGLAAARTPAATREPVVALTGAVAESMLTIVRWLLAVAPIGVFALAAPLAARTGLAAVGALGFYVAAISGLFLLTTAALYPVAAIAGRVPLGRFARTLAPAQVVAATSRSSLASLPALLDAVERGALRLSPHATSFVLPLAASIFKLSTPITWVVSAVFAGRLYGVTPTPLELGTIAAAAVVLSLGMPGVPSASLLLMAPMFVSMGIPVEAIGILIAADAIPDLAKTVMNVTAFLTVAVILGRPAPPPPAGAAAPAP